jgi:phenylpropionate dioxygenase-like ring-hydroxylating dioxygenase large terminal subunit
MPAPVPRVGLEAMLSDGAPGRMLPAKAYTSDEVLAWERRHLFADSWVCAGRSADLTEPGDRRAVRVGDDAVVLVRGDDGVLRAFFNVCRHRGHELQACDTTVRRSAIHCPYHAWTYALDGTLASTPRYEAPDGFDPADHTLSPVRAEEWRGWVFVNASGDAQPLADHLGDLDAELARWEPDRLVAVATHTYELAANWKLPVENYHECFHCRSIHPELCLLTPPDSGQNSSGHRGLWIGGWMALADGIETMSMTGRSDGSLLPGIDATWERRVHYLGLVPNLLISPHPDYVMVHRLEPVAPHRTLVECQWLFDPDTAARAGFDPRGTVDFWDRTNRQDWAACEAVQRGVSSRGFRPGPFAGDEDAVAQFVRLVARAYRDGALPAAVL